jgi:hypothetical protein
MPIVSVSRWKINPEDASRVVREVAPLLKVQGASRVTLGRIHTGQSTVVIAYNDWEAYGKAMEAQHKDTKFQQLYGQAVKSGAELQERNVLSVEEA